MADTFTRDKLTWIENVTCDPRLPHVAVRITNRLALAYMNRQSGAAWPSIDTLASDLSVSASTIRSGLKALVNCGHLEIRHGGGRSASNRYRWLIGGEKPSKKLKGKQPKPSEKLKGFEAENPSEFCTKTLQVSEGEPSEGNPLKGYREDIPPTPIEEDRRKSAAVSPTAADHPPASEKISEEPDGFADWWDQYPTGWQTHETARPDQERRRAERAWRALLRAGEDPRKIIAETMKFGQHVAEALDAGAEARFIAQPSNFLKGRKWETPERWPRAPGNVVPMSDYRGGGQRDQFDPVAWAAEFEAQSAAASNWWRS